MIDFEYDVVDGQKLPYPHWQRPSCPIPAIKIVRVIGGGFFSAQESIAAIEYLVGQDVTPVPNAGPLCVFEQTLWALPYYLGHIGEGQPEFAIFSCWYIPTRDAQWMWLPGGENCPMSAMANGTIMADKVKLIQRWTPDDISRELRALNLYV